MNNIKKNFLRNLIRNKGIYLILILLVIKIIFGFHLENFNPNFFFTTDSYEYINPAKQICENGKFYNIYNEAEIRRTPGTSIFLLPAICLNINLSKYMFLLNLVMILLSAFYTLKIIKLLNITVSPILIFLIYLFDPTISKHQYNILSDIIFLFWFTLTLYFLVKGLKKNNIYYFFFGFFLITIDTFIRPITLYLPYFLTIFYLLFYSFSSSFRNKFSYSLMIACLLGTVIHFCLTQLWSYRNFKQTGIKEFTYLEVQNNYLYKTAGIIAKKENRKFLDVQEEFRNKINDLSKNEFVDFSNAEIKKAILNNPLETVMVGLEGAIMTFLTPGTGQYPRMFSIDDRYYKLSKNLFNSAGFLWIFVFLIFASYGILKIEKEIIFLLFVLIFLYLVLASSGPGSYSRFRIPFTPLILIFISCGLQNFLVLFKKIYKYKD